MPKVVLDVDKPLLWQIASFPPQRSWGSWHYRDDEEFLAVRMARSLLDDVPISEVTFDLDAARLVTYDLLAVALLPPVVGERCAALLDREAPGDVQLLPVPVTAKGEPIGPYWVVNAIRTVACIDYDRSVIRATGSGPAPTKDIRRLALRPEAMGSTLVARDADYLPLLYVAPRLAALMIAARLRGLRLVTGEDAYAHWVVP